MQGWHHNYIGQNLKKQSINHIVSSANNYNTGDENSSEQNPQVQ
jgi:hypothetical protein